MKQNKEITGIGERLKKVRGSDALHVFADKLGVHKNTLGRYEREENSPDADFLIQICVKFNINPTWLLIGEGPMEEWVENSIRRLKVLIDQQIEYLEETGKFDTEMAGSLLKLVKTIESWSASSNGEG